MKNFLRLQVFMLLMLSGYVANAQTFIDTIKTVPNFSSKDYGINNSSKIVYNDTIYFVYRDSSDVGHLAKYNHGNNTISIVPDNLNPTLTAAGTGFQYCLTVFNSELYLAYQDNVNLKMVKYNGTSFTSFTSPTTQINSYLYPLVLNNDMYILVQRISALPATQLLKCDGNTLSLVNYPATSEGISAYTSPVLYNNNLYYVYAYPTNKTTIAKFDGTSFTKINSPSLPGYPSQGELKLFNNAIYFGYKDSAANQNVLAKYDGTSITVFNSPIGTGSGLTGAMVEYNNNLYFYNKQANSSYQLAKYDGTSVSQIPNPSNGSVNVDIAYSKLIVFKGNLYGTAAAGLGSQLFKYDGNDICIINNSSFTSTNYFTYPIIFDNSLYTITNTTTFSGGPFGTSTPDIRLNKFDECSSFARIANAKSYAGVSDEGPYPNTEMVFKNKLYFRNEIKTVYPGVGQINTPTRYYANLGYINPSVVSQKNVSCNGGSDAWAKVTSPPVCGTGSNTYLWTPGNQTTDSIGGLSAGTYSVQITCGASTTTQTVVITEPAVVGAPTASNQIFCGSKTVADLVATGISIKWYATATGGTSLPKTDVLVSGNIYYASQTIGCCEGTARVADTVTISSASPAPITTNQSLCPNATVADLVATGTNIKWYTAPTGGTALASTTALTTATKYYATQNSTGCESDVRAVDSVTINSLSATPNDGLIIFTGSKTLSQLGVQATSSIFYKNGTGGTALAGTTIAEDDSTYYITQTTNGCESARKAILLNRIGNDSAVKCAPATIADLTATPNTGDTTKWYSSANATSSLDLTTTIPEGTNTYYVEESNSSTNILDTIPSNPFHAINASTIGETDSVYYGLFGDSAKIFRINPDGTSRTLISKGNAGESIRFLQFEKTGTDRFLLYTYEDEIKSRNLATGMVTTLGSGYFRPRQLSRDVANNKIYVADAERGRIRLLDLSTNMSTTVDSLQRITPTFVARPFAVCYSAPNTLYFSDFERNIVYAKNLTTGVRTDSINLQQVTSIKLLPNGKLLINAANGIYTANADLSNLIRIVVVNNTNYSGYNSNGDLIYDNYYNIKKLSTKLSDRVPVTVVVNPTSTVDAISDKVVCNGAVIPPVTFSSPTTGGTVTYDWANNNTAIGLAASGTGNIVSFNATNTTNRVISATITVTPSITNAGVTCTGTETTFRITVNPTATVDTISNEVVCNQSIVSAINFSTPTIVTRGSSITYAWANNNTTIGLGASGTGNIASFTATNTSTAAVSATITVTPTFTNGGVSCTGTATTFTITVNPPPIFATTTDKYVCNNSTTTAIAFTTALTGGTAVYNWTNDNTAIGLAASGTGNVPGFTAANTTAAPIFGEIIVSMDYTNAGLTCTSLNDTFAIVVNPTATVNAVTNQVHCNTAATTAVTFGSPTTGGTIVYNWTATQHNTGIAASGTGNLASYTATNTTTAPIIDTITVTPTFTNGGISCTGVAKTFTITVNPTATVTAVSNMVKCNGDATSANFSSPTTGGTIVYNWTNNNTAINLAANGTGNIASFNATNNTAAPITATITVTPSFTNAGVTCTGTARTFTITVNPTATVNTVANQTVCNAAPITAVTFTSPNTGGTIVYNWTNSNTAVGLAASGTGNIASFNATNTTTAPITATITVTPSITNGGITCAGTAKTFTIIVNPTAVVNNISSQTLCTNNATATVTFSGPVAGTSYTWVNNNTSIGLAASGSGNIPSFNAINLSPVTATATITVTPNTAAGCVGATKTFTYTIYGLSIAPAAIATPALVLCDTNKVTSLSAVGGQLATGANWYWYKDSCGGTPFATGAVVNNITVPVTTTFYVRAEGNCNKTACASVTVQVAKLVTHVRQHWNDVLFFDNSSKNYVQWQWYKNDILVQGATLPYYSENNTPLSGLYHVVATDKNGNKLITCPLVCTPTGFHGIELKANPNPVPRGQSFTVVSGLTQDELQGAIITVKDMFGTAVTQANTVSPVTALQAPNFSGLYIVNLVLRNGQKYSVTIVVI